jgi:hypothetical protein
MSARDRLLPAAIREQVVRAIYADADRLGWQTLPLADRTAIFNRWIEDGRVGGPLTRFMTPEQARSWIKDGPMKEYGRALRGAGRFAEYGRQGGTGPVDVVWHALGPTAIVVDGSYGSKPLHCHGKIDGTTAYVAWDHSRNFKNLLWAGLRASALDGLDAHLVVLEPPGTASPSELVKEQQELAERCGLTVHRMREVLGTPGGEP